MSKVVSPLTQAPVLAQVATPAGPSYVPQALNYAGLVVQRRYRGVGTPYRTHAAPQAYRAESVWEEYYAAEPHLVPIVHAAAVAAAGLNYEQVAQEARWRGPQLLEHPTYGPLCLR